MNRLIISLLFFVTVSFAQDTTWTKTFGDSLGESARSVQQTTDGGYIIAGYTSSLVNGTARPALPFILLGIEPEELD